MQLAQFLAFLSLFLHNCLHKCTGYAFSTKFLKACVVSTHISVVCLSKHFYPFFPHRPISSSGKYSEYKPSWPPEPIGQNKLWKTNRNNSQLPRPPPGLTNQKQATPSPWGSGGPRLARNWGGVGINQESRFGPGTVYIQKIQFFLNK